MSNDGPVGYKKPPKNWHWSKGTSGNPRGRPKGKKSPYTAFDRVMRKLVSASSGSGPRITMEDAIFLRLTQSALKGDVRAIRLILMLMQLSYEHKMNNLPLSERWNGLVIPPAPVDEDAFDAKYGGIQYPEYVKAGK